MKKILKYSLIIFIIFSISIFTIPIQSLYKSNYIEFYDINGNLITSEINEKPSKYIYLEELNPDTINAFIAFEDKHFYKHNGFDFLRIVKSFFTNLISKDVISGASTITQQYARILFLNNDKTLLRKIKEAYYTIRIETSYSKDEILEGYLNNIYLGHGCYGIECASNYYFNKSSKELTLNESALLASLASSPTSASPLNNYSLAMKRKNKVLESMYKEKYINKNKYLENVKTNIDLNTQISKKDNIHYYLDRVKSEIKELKIPYNKGLKVYTNFDLNIYKLVNEIVTSYSSKENEISVLIFKNNSNKIVFNLGGYNYTNSSYNRALYSKRQIGSTIKTFLFSLALENNLDINTYFKSEKTTFHIKNHPDYSPSNANNKYANASINMEEAFATSDNIYATKLLLLLGSKSFANYLSKFKLNTTISLPSLALGSAEFTLLELSKAYAVFANNGHYIDYSFINYIVDSYNNTLYSSSNNEKTILSNKAIKKMKGLLKLPFQKGNYYTNSTMGTYEITNMYGKTGSTKTDSYVIGFNDSYLVAIRCGVDEMKNQFYSYSIPKKILKEISQVI